MSRYRTISASMAAHGTTRCELDSHADTCAFGTDAHVVRIHSSDVSVSGFHSDFPSLSNVSVADVAVAYDCPYTYQTYILFFNQVLLIKKMKHHLLNPDQLREHGCIVNDVPLLRIHPQHRHPNNHCILPPNTTLRIPLEYHKPISSFLVRKPTQSEVNDPINHLHVEMTSPLEWRPYDSQSTSDEQSLRLSLEHQHHAIQSVISSSPPPCAELCSISCALDQTSLLAALGDYIRDGVEPTGDVSGDVSSPPSIRPNSSPIVLL